MFVGAFPLLVVHLLLSCIQVHQTMSLGIQDLYSSAKNIGSGVITDSANLLPSPQGLFETGKQALAGYPFEFVSTSINRICSSAVASKAITPKITPDIDKMKFQLRTSCHKYSFPLLEAQKMWLSPEFDPKKKVVILATGWTTTVNESNTIDVLAKAYNCRGDVNFIAVDAAEYVDTLYTWSALNTEAIGESIGMGLTHLADIVPIANIHLIGHSLGAHIVGAAGRYFTYVTNETLERITGLDPAKPCFNEGENLAGLLRGDAKFIDVIHSNPGVLGKRDPLGDADFYPGGLDPLAPGCLSVTCAHQRAWEYFAETVYPGNEHCHMAVRCGSLTKLRENKCPGQKVPMGYATPRDLKGNYFLEVNSAAPYGVNTSPQYLQTMRECGLCQKKN